MISRQNREIQEIKYTFSEVELRLKETIYQKKVVEEQLINAVSIPKTSKNDSSSVVIKDIETERRLSTALFEL